MGLCMSLFIGRTTKGVDLKYTSGNKPMAVATVNLAVDTGYGDKKRSNYFKLKAFGKVAENMNKYIPKGTKIRVTCVPTQERWENKEGKTVTAEWHYVQDWEFCESKSSHQEKPSVPEPAPAPANQPWMNMPDDFDTPFV